MPKTILLLLTVFLLGCQTTEAIVSLSGETNSVTDDTKEVVKTVKIGSIDWYVDYDAALKVAKEKKLPVWLHFGENPG